MATERLNRINELAHKAKTVGLTPEELEERDRLRKEYLEAFRKNMMAELDNIYMLDEHGNEVPIRKKNT